MKDKLVEVITKYTKGQETLYSVDGGKTWHKRSSFHKQWKEADKMFRIPLWKRIIFFHRYKKQCKGARKLVDDVIGKMPTPTWKP